MFQIARTSVKAGQASLRLLTITEMYLWLHVIDFRCGEPMLYSMIDQMALLLETISDALQNLEQLWPKVYDGFCR